MFTIDKAATFAFEAECGHRLQEISLFAYENFLEQGRGVVFLEPDNSQPEKFRYGYSTVEQTERYQVDLSEYDPKKEIIVVMYRPDGTTYVFPYQFRLSTLWPSYVYDLKQKGL